MNAKKGRPTARRIFLKNAVILTACALLLSGIAMAMRVYQTAVIGAEGVGLLQLLLSVYFFATNLAVSGLNLAVTRLVSESTAPGGVPVRVTLRRCFALSGCTGVGAGTLLFFGAPAAAHGLGDLRAAQPLRILACSLPLFAVSACCRGYFLAVRRSLAPGLGQLLEQVCAFAVMRVLLPLAAPHGMAAACSAAALGMAAGELCGNIWIVAALLLDRRRAARTEPPRTGALPLRRVGAIALPVALGYDLRAALIAVENGLAPAGLRRCGQSAAESLAAYGTVKGMALPTIQFPAAFLAAFSQLLIPEVAQSRAEGRSETVRALASRVFRICLAFSLFVTNGFLAFGDDLGRVLFGSAGAGAQMRMLCPLVPLMYLDSIVDAMLKGLDEQNYSLRVNMSDSCIRIALMALLLPRWGMAGYLTAFYCSTVYNASLSIARLVHRSRLRVEAGAWIAVPALCAATACLWSALLVRLTPPLCHAALPVNLAARCALAAALYLPMLALCARLCGRPIRRRNQNSSNVTRGSLGLPRARNRQRGAACAQDVRRR